MITNNVRMMRLEAEISQIEKESLNLLLDISKVIMQELELDRLMKVIMDKTRQVLRADRCSVFLVDHECHSLWTIAAHGMQRRQIRVPSGKGLVGHVALSGETLNVKDAYRDVRFNPELDRKTGYRTRCILSMPIKDKKGRIIGVFQALNKKSGTFTLDDERLLEGVAGFAAIAIDNARMYEELRRKTDERVTVNVVDKENELVGV